MADLADGLGATALGPYAKWRYAAEDRRMVAKGELRPSDLPPR